MFDYNLLTCCSLFKLPRATSWSLVKYPFLHTEGLKVAVWLLPTAPLTLRKKKLHFFALAFGPLPPLPFLFLGCALKALAAACSKQMALEPLAKIMVC